MVVPLYCIDDCQRDRPTQHWYCARGSVTPHSFACNKSVCFYLFSFNTSGCTDMDMSLSEWARCVVTRVCTRVKFISWDMPAASTSLCSYVLIDE